MTDEAPAHYTLTLPLPPNIANEARNWRGRHWKKVGWTDQAALAVGLRFPATCFTRARVQCFFSLWSKMDADNLAARQKWVLDFLRKPVCTVMGKRMQFGGWIADDDEGHLELIPPEQKVDRKNRRVVVHVERLAPDWTPL